jgi:phenylalanyl-tRNA synthetase beta chain
LEISEKNKTQEIKIFEIGHVHFRDKKAKDNLPLEEINLSVLISRKKSKKHKRDIFFELKGVMEFVLTQLGIEKTEYLDDVEKKGYRISCKCMNSKKHIGSMKVLDESILNNFSQNGKEIAVFEISLTKIINLVKPDSVYKQLSKFPEVVLGMTLIVPEAVSIKELLGNIQNRNELLIESINVVDIYRGDQIGEGKKSVVLDLIYRAPDRTLEESEIQKIHSSIIETLGSLGIRHR